MFRYLLSKTWEETSVRRPDFAAIDLKAQIMKKAISPLKVATINDHHSLFFAVFCMRCSMIFLSRELY